MGLDIQTRNASYHVGYYGLHLVRELALIACGYPKEVQGFPAFYILPEGLTGPLLQKAISASIVCGFIYPNLMLHSDCEGKYTSSGKPMEDANWFSGNSKKLVEELVDLKNSFSKTQRIGRAWEIFDMLYKVAKDAVKNKEPLVLS